MRPLIVFLFAVCAVLSSIEAYAFEKMALLGAGAVVSTSPYRGMGSKVMPIPLVVWEFKNFYLKGVEVGYHFFKSEDLTLSVLASPRFMGYDSDDSTALNGMEDRRMSVDVGLKADYRLPFGKEYFSGVKLLTDAGGRSRGQVAEASLSKKIGPKHFQVTPSVGARFQSGRLVDYYYGVRSGEVRADRPAYEPGSAVNYFGDVMLNFAIHRKWIVVTRIGVESLDSEIRKSPLVNKDYLVTGVVGLTRKF